MKNLKNWTISCLVIFIAISSFFVWVFRSMPNEVVIPIKEKIEQVIKVKSAENIVEKSKHIGLGGGLSVGMGAAQIACQSIEQFIDLVPKGERIFISLKINNDKTKLTKTYLSFIENRNGIIIYEDEYSYSEKGFVFYGEEDYNWQKIIFRKKGKELGAIILMVGITTASVWSIVMIIIPGIMFRRTLD